MSVDAPLVIAPDGAMLAAGDGPELLAWRNDGAPAWKVFTEGVLVGVVAGLEHVVTIDADGLLCRWRRTDGELVSSDRIGHTPLALILAADGRTVAVVTSEGPMVEFPHGLQLVPMPGTTAAAFGPDGALGVGRRDGTFTALELKSGAAWGSIKLGAAVGAVAWSSLGSWLVGCELVLYRVSGDATTMLASLPGADKPITQLACAQNGLVAAARAGDHVELWELHADRPLGEFVLRRAITSVCFGPALILGIGLEDGDGNWVDLATGATFRTEPHPGRARNTWRLENRVDIGAVRGAIARHQAGGAPIARYVPRPDPDDEGGAGGWLAGCLSVLTAMFLLSAMCGGLMLLMYVLRTYGLWKYLPIR